MAKILKVLGIVVLLAGSVAATPAVAQHHGHAGWHGGGGWHRGGWGWGPGFGLGLGLGYGWGYPYYYAGGPYYAQPACDWTRVRVWRYGHWAIRRAWRCW